MFAPSTQARYSPLCEGKCKGTDRPVADSPAVWAKMPDGTKGLACTCCVLPLRLATGLEAGIADAPNIRPEFSQAGRKRWICDQCGYDIVTIPELKLKA